jgi:hypothetical protein
MKKRKKHTEKSNISKNFADHDKINWASGANI